MSNQLDYYGVLQVHPGAEKEIIDAAYRRLAAKYHPDISHASDATERMKQINIAYEVLSDPIKRAAYDDASRGGAPLPSTPPQAAPRSQYASMAWRILLIAAGIMLLAVVAFRGTALMLLVPRIVVPLAVISLVVWFFFTLTKSRR